MSDVVIRARSAPRPAPQIAAMRWPNGSAVYTEGSVPKSTKCKGWIVRKRDGTFEVHQRIGPTEDDSKLLGTAPDFGQALTKLGDKLWPAFFKPVPAPIRKRTK